MACAAEGDRSALSRPHMALKRGKRAPLGRVGRVSPMAPQEGAAAAAGKGQPEAGAGSPRLFTWEEVALRNGQGRPAAARWLVIDRKVYDVSRFHKKHPGGSRVISGYAGQDATVSRGACGWWWSSDFEVDEFIMTLVQAHLQRTAAPSGTFAACCFSGDPSKRQSGRTVICPSANFSVRLLLSLFSAQLL